MVEFRQAGAEDVPEIIALTNECFEENTPVEFAERVFAETANDPNTIYLGGYLDGKLVAHTRIAIIKTIYEENEYFCDFEPRLRETGCSSPPPWH